MAYQPFNGITSIVSTVPSSVQVGASVMGTVPVTQASTWIASVFGNVSVIGTVPVTQAGIWATSMVGVASVTQAGIWNVGITASVGAAVTNITASIAANLQSTNASIFTVVNSSVAAYVTWPLASIAGTYNEDNAHTTQDRGIFMLHVRNDTLASVTSTDQDYSTNAVGPSGETVVANSPFTKWIQADTSIMANVSVQAMVAQGTSIFTYITAVQLANTSPNNVYVTFTGGLGGKSSVLGYAPAPANSGAVLTLPNAWKTGANSGVSASVSGMGSVFLSLQGFIAKI